MKHLALVYCGVATLCLLAAACTKDVGRIKKDTVAASYPPAVGDILLNKCATAGCHNTISREAAGGINFDTWIEAFKGGRNGAVIIPYRPDQSTLLYYTNTYNEFGSIQLSPRMPYNSAALSKDEIKVVYDWIKNGAPDSEGNIQFPDNSSSPKFYVANRGCDLVTVFDANSMLAARYVDVGETRGIESPVMLRVAPNKQHWYASFVAGGFFIKYSTGNNAQVSKVNLGPGNWFNFTIGPDSKTAWLCDLSANGKIARVNLDNMTFSVAEGFAYPAAVTFDPIRNKLLVAAQAGNYVYQVNPDNLSASYKFIVDGSSAAGDHSGMGPTDLLLFDAGKLAVSCQNSDEVRILDLSTQKVLYAVPVGKKPQKMAISNRKPYLFVVCADETGGTTNQKSRIYIVNYQTGQVVKNLYAGFESAGLAVDDENGRVYVCNRNVSSGGPAPHHQSLCGGRNGYITAIDLNTLEVMPNFKAEVSTDPYFVEMEN